MMVMVVMVTAMSMIANTQHNWGWIGWDVSGCLFEWVSSKLETTPVTSRI